MSGEIRFSVTYPHPPERVWLALTDRHALASWLMPNDFEPVVGHRFTLRTSPAPGFDGIVHCQVLRLDPPRVLSYSWKGGPVDTALTFTLEAVETGTRLTLEHTGFAGVAGRSVGWMLGQGWRRKARTLLPETIDRISQSAAGLSCVPDDGHRALSPRMRLSMHVAGRVTQLVRAVRPDHRDDKM